MNADIYDEFKHTWDGTETGWRLLRVDLPEHVPGPPYAIVNIETRSVLMISAPEVKTLVVEKLLAEKVPVINELTLRS